VSGEEFKTDDDSFDTAEYQREVALKTKRIIYCGFGILVALSQYRTAMAQQER
jgi:hypothetical protein